MEVPLSISATLSHTAALAGTEPEEPLYALIRLQPAPAPQRPRLEFACLLDASASMYQFRLDPQERERWRRLAEERGDIRRQIADGREAIIWTGRTLQEMQRQISTPMLSAARALWRGLQALDPNDAVAVLAFNERVRVILDDPGGSERTPTARAATAREALALLGQPLSQAGLEQETRLEEALRAVIARWQDVSPPRTARRLLLISDGVVVDRDACLSLVESFPDCGIVVSTVGVGGEFDEELLMRVADITRGNYTYAPTALDLERALAEEFAQMLRVVARQVRFSFHLSAQALLRSFHQVSPQIAAFPLMWADAGVREFHLGEVRAEEAVELLAELAPAAASEGNVEIARVVARGQSLDENEAFTVEHPLSLLAVTDPALAHARDESVIDAVARTAVYLEERRAQEALDRGQGDAATRHLQVATRMLRKMGAETLAADMEAAAAEIQAGTRSLSRTKRIKAGTRRLGTPGNE
ncbi:MAG: VWA domain-containing protein [Armatimonadetes bacterium]|nr:VWA domain-containing protein [Armatimonadota bacterium]